MREPTQEDNLAEVYPGVACTPGRPYAGHAPRQEGHPDPALPGHLRLATLNPMLGEGIPGS